MTGEVRLEDTAHDLPDLMSTVSALLGKYATEAAGKTDELIREATRAGKRTAPFARAAVIFTSLALILLCTFAIKALLSI